VHAVQLIHAHQHATVHTATHVLTVLDALTVQTAKAVAQTAISVTMVKHGSHSVIKDQTNT
jgi:hypothetical protein